MADTPLPTVLKNATEEYLLSLSFVSYNGPPTKLVAPSKEFRESGEGVMRLKVNPFGVSVSRVTIGWVSSIEKRVGQEEWEPKISKGEGLVQWTVLGDLAGKDLERRPEADKTSVKDCLDEVPTPPRPSGPLTTLLWLVLLPLTLLWLLLLPLVSILDFIETYFIKIRIGPLAGETYFFTIAVNLGGLEWAYVSCLKAGEGLLTVRSLGFINKQKEEDPEDPCPPEDPKEDTEMA